jgi:hypothetical protein
MRIYTYATKRFSMRQPSALRRSTLAALAFGLTAAAFGLGGTPLTAPAQAADVFVAPTGTDAADGSAEKPVATLRRALDRVREIRAAEPARDTPIEVELADGRYELAQTVEIAGEDSGTERSPTVIRSIAGGRAVLSGGRTVPQWLPVTDEAVVARLDPAARGHVVQADLKALGIADYGVMSGGFALSGGPGLELFHDDVPMTVARYPNKGFIKITEVLGPTPIDVRGTIGCQEARFQTDDQRVARWAAEPAGMVLGYWFWDWAEQRHLIESIDAAGLILTLKEPFHCYGYRKGQWFYGFNLLCELDTPGEWYLDRDRGILYFWPPTAAGAGTSVVSVLGSLVSAKDASHVMLRGLTFEAARGTGATILGGRCVTIAGCIFHNLGGAAVGVWGTGHRVTGCDISNTGDGGIALGGGDRKSLTPGGNVADNNHIHHYGRWNRMYRNGIAIDGVGNRAAHNLIHHAPHIAISFGGNDHVLEFNEIHHVCEESNDAGAVYCGRDWTCRGNLICHNHFHDITGFEGKGCVGVYLDDQFSSARIEGNVFRRVTNAAFIGGGRDNAIVNNLFIDCTPAVHVDARGLGWAAFQRSTLMQRLADMPWQEEPWKSRYPELSGLDADPGQMTPAGNVIERNIQCLGKWDEIEAAATPFLTLRNNLLGIDPAVVDEKGGNFQLRDESFARNMGFEQIPFDKIGLRVDEFRPSLPAP